MLKWQVLDYTATSVINQSFDSNRKISQGIFPCDLEISIVLNEAYAYVLFDTVSVYVHLIDNNIVCTVQDPLALHFLKNVQENNLSDPGERYGK
jgi:hypothetical protein